jgi:predicted CoA-binding protein
MSSEDQKNCQVIGDATKKKGVKVIWMQLAVYNEGALAKEENTFSMYSSIDL